uniref:Immunoglobulin C1-set domain-containing protein n=1 Tax=Leptobrachium leishanense TaxID=445787 RepID=A0A8C5WGE1_9ANUR
LALHGQTFPDPDYLDQGKCDCHFTNGTERVRFLRDISTTRSLFTSTSGNTLQKPNAGNQFAVPNYDILHSVKISVTASVNDLYQYKHTIICNIFGFYPSGIEVKWFRNEQTTQVRYLGPHSDGDWTYHWAGMYSLLQKLLKRGKKSTHQFLRACVLRTLFLTNEEKKNAQGL